MSRAPRPTPVVASEKIKSLAGRSGEGSKGVKTLRFPVRSPRVDPYFGKATLYQCIHASFPNGKKTLFYKWKITGPPLLTSLVIYCMTHRHVTKVQLLLMTLRVHSDFLSNSSLSLPPVVIVQQGQLENVNGDFPMSR